MVTINKRMSKNSFWMEDGTSLYLLETDSISAII